MPDRLARARLLRNIPPEVLNLVGTAGAIFAVVVSGAAIASVLPQDGSPWLTASAYGAPAGLAFLAYWWVAQRL